MLGTEKHFVLEDEEVALPGALHRDEEQVFAVAIEFRQAVEIPRQFPPTCGFSLSLSLSSSGPQPIWDYDFLTGPSLEATSASKLWNWEHSDLVRAHRAPR